MAKECAAEESSEKTDGLETLVCDSLESRGASTADDDSTVEMENFMILLWNDICKYHIECGVCV